MNFDELIVAVTKWKNTEMCSFIKYDNYGTHYNVEWRDYKNINYVSIITFEDFIEYFGNKIYWLERRNERKG